MSQTYLVTGATGFVGGALARKLLQDGHRVVTICRDGQAPPGCRVIRGDIENHATCLRAMTEYRPDIVYHLAAQAIVGHARVNPLATFEANVRGTYNMLEAFRQVVPKSVFVLASSDKAYGSMRGEAYTESHPLKGEGPYDCSKSCADLIAQSYCIEYGLWVGVVRAGNIYGPGDDEPTRLIPSIVRDLVNGCRPVIKSDGYAIRDYLYIDDAVSGYMRLGSYLQGTAAFFSGPGAANCVNLAGGEAASVLDVVNMLIDVSLVSPFDDRPEPVITGERGAGEIHTQVLDTRKAQAMLGWSPTVNLREGLRRTWSEAVRSRGSDLSRI